MAEANDRLANFHRIYLRIQRHPWRARGSAAATLLLVTRDWLLVETLGEEPVVVGQGRQVKNFVPIGVFLRRNPNLSAIQTAIAETVATGSGLASITPKTNRVIRTEPVVMTDGRIHGVHVWCGPSDAEPPDRPTPGPLKWDLTIGEATDSVEALINAGMDPAVEPTHGRSFADDFPSSAANHDEAKVLALAIEPEPGGTYCATWDGPDKLGFYRRTGFVSRITAETADDGTEHLIARAMNLVVEVRDTPFRPDDLAKRILTGTSQPGIYRAILDLNTWALLKWLDEPCPLFNWRGSVATHPDDHEHFSERITEELTTGSTSAVLRLPGNDGGWVPLHVTIARIELEDGVFAGLVTLRLPTAEELADVSIPADEFAS